MKQATEYNLEVMGDSLELAGYLEGNAWVVSV